MNVPFLDLKAQHQHLQEDINRAVQNVFTRTAFILGEEVGQFESEFAAYCGIQHAIGVDSGLSALKLALKAFGIGQGDEVIVPANTFIATAAAVTFVGAQVVLADVKPDSYNIDPERIEAAITPRTKAIIPVHLYGIAADMDDICAIAKRHGLVVIEDACQAHGAAYKRKRVGTFGHAAAFSFYPGKNLGAAGDAGMVVTDDSKVADDIRSMRNCGQSEKYHHVTAPYNHRMDTIQAAILGVKLKHLDVWNAKRRKKAALYTQLLQNVDVVTPSVPSGVTAVWHLYVIRAGQRDQLVEHLASRDIETGMHYPIPLHLQPFYSSLAYREGDFPITESYTRQIVSLPIYPEMSDEAIHYVVESIQEFVGMPQGAHAP